jgi:hypothetical protein
MSCHMIFYPYPTVLHCKIHIKMMTSFANLLFDQIHHFAKNIHNINDGHLAQIIQLKCAHT